MTRTSLIDTIHALDVRLQASIDARLRDVGLTGAQWRALDAALERAGSSSADLARHCGVTAQSMQAIVATLEEEGLLVRQPHEVHGRVLQIFVSNAGERRHAEGATLIAEVEDQLLSALIPEEREEFNRLLAMALGGLRRT